MSSLVSAEQQEDCYGCLLQENMRVLADKWKNMSQTRKEPYEKQAEYDARRYQIEVSILSVAGVHLEGL